jgi:glycosyltransferase involved in cell wall biosynthesis
MGVRWRKIVPAAPPWNPFGGSNPVLCALDPLRALRVLLRHRDADVIVSVFESNALVILLLRTILRFRPKIILWDASVGTSWKVLRVIQKLTLPRYDGFMMLTGAQERHLREHFDIKVPVARIGYNVDESFYRPGRKSTDGDYVLAVGDDISRDYSTLLAAASRTPSRFLIKSAWRPTASSGAVSANVTFLSRRLSREEFRALYEGARIVVLPLHTVDHAGGITALFEAMAMGKPLIVTASGVARDFVTDEIHALLVPHEDPAALAGAVNRLEQDEALRLKLGANARRHIEDHFSTRALAERMVDFLKGVCEQDSKASI